MVTRIASIGLAAVLGACGYVSEYERAVYDLEPTYCYKSLGQVACYKEPFHRDERRLVNYFGPDPSRYDKLEPPEPTPIQAPEMVNYWVKDAEPIPRPAPTGKLSSLPWLDPAVAATETRRLEFARLSADPKGTEALLGKMGIGPHGEIRWIDRGPVRRQIQTQIPGQGDEFPVLPAPGREAAVSQPPPAAQPKPPVVEVEVDVN